jgi:hypothetical protein
VDGALEPMAAAVPPMTGAEYLTAGVLAELWRGMDAAFDVELAQAALENRLGDPWSIFDFVNPGLLGSAKQFSGFVKVSSIGRATPMDRCATWCVLASCGASRPTRASSPTCPTRRR